MENGVYEAVLWGNILPHLLPFFEIAPRLPAQQRNGLVRLSLFSLVHVPVDTMFDFTSVEAPGVAASLDGVACFFALTYFHPSPQCARG